MQSNGETGLNAIARLAAAARADLAALAHPQTAWVVPDTGAHTPIDDVVIVGGGQSGVVIATALAREGVHGVTVLDAAPLGEQGPWSTYARMRELRTPKQLVGTELGVPNLSVRSWFIAMYGEDAWERIERVPRLDWQRYLDWYADTTGVGIVTGTQVTGVSEGANGSVIVESLCEGVTSRRRARAVVLATGFDGAGAWRVPEFVSDALPSDRYDHSNAPIDFDALAGRRVGVLGHGAAAFDNSIAALRAGAESVDLCFRRDRLPRTNPHRFLETAGVMTHYPELSDSTRWQIAKYFRDNDQPPPLRSFGEAMKLPGFHLHPATPWTELRMAHDEIEVDTPRGRLRFDHVILATGAVVDLSARPELRSLAPVVELWSDRYQPPPALADDRLAALPYLGDGYQFIGRSEADAWVERVFAFNFASAVSHAPHSTSISGHKHALPRVVRGITRRLLIDSEASLLDGLLAYDSLDLPIDNDFEDRVAAPVWDAAATNGAP